LALLSGLASAQEKKRTGCAPPDECVKAMKVHEGLEASFWAGEPGLINPTNMDIDERGRIWCVESMNYRGSKMRPEGDRIVIMEDTKGQGKADSYKVFYQDKAIIGPLGITVLGNKVYVAQSPRMWVFTIDDSGDKAVGPPEVLFDGFTGENHDHGLHSIMFGPDGRFYFNSGNAGIDGARVKNGKGEPVVDSTGSEVGAKATKWRGGPRGGAGQHYTNGMAFRCNPDGSGFETLGYNFRNNYEVCSDSFGTAWQSDNDDDGNQGVRINYVMEGGNFGYVGYAKDSSWGRDQSAYPGQSRQEAHWHQRDPGVVPNLLMTGGGSPTGILAYEGDLPGLRGKLIHCDAGPNVVRIYTPIPAAAGYKCSSVDLVKSSDRWFRPADVCVGLQGEIYIADWTDPGVGGHATGDKDPATISGRIYRIAPPGFKFAPPKLDLGTVKGQIDALLSPNLSRRYVGYQKLAAGGAEATKALLEVFQTSTVDQHRARALWLLARGEGGPKVVKQALSDKSLDIRVAALRAARLIKMDMVEIAKELLGDPSPVIARELCLAMAYESTGKCLDVLVALGDKVQPQNSYDGVASKDWNTQEEARQERYVPKWYLEAFGIACTNREKEVLEAWTKNGKNKDPKVAEAITWRLNRVIPEPAPPPPKKG
ncbi:MAG TPA: PVC-type heme-binding CxxCH protein, partial [Planctomycetota bacterium]|nr:PVC-type heme-binding CxxCH protein [Planctomycetota bacterium]